MADNFFIFGAEYLYFAILFIALIFFLKQPREVKKEIVILGVLSLPIIYAVAKIAGILYPNPTPFEQEGFIPLIPHEADNGFPSDHTLLSAALASLIYPFSKKASSILWFLTILVGVSRMYVGVHYLADILGAIFIAVLITALVYYGLIRVRRKSNIIREGA